MLCVHLIDNFKLIWVLLLLVRKITRLSTLFHIVWLLRPNKKFEVLKYMKTLFSRVVIYISLLKPHEEKDLICLVHHCSPSLAECVCINIYV